jgi:inorganic pyrophosphatase
MEEEESRRPAMQNPGHDLSPGKNLPKEVDAVVGILLGSNVKLELDKPSGLLRLDWLLFSALFYPANDGFIPAWLQTAGTHSTCSCHDRSQCRPDHRACPRDRPDDDA